jgi:hypothetical protein
MSEYRRKRKRAERTYARRRPWLSRVGGQGRSAGYSPRNYFRHHDFKYEREPETKPPKLETHYAIERPIDTYRPPAFYQPELNQTSVEKIVEHAIEKYRPNDSERGTLEDVGQNRRNPESENLPEINIESSTETGPVTPEENAAGVALDVSAQPELPQEFNAITDQTLEPSETMELPIADLELLLVELDTNPLELRPEINVEAQGGRVEHAE